MQKYYLSPTSITPEIHLSPDENIFFIRGISSPEDVRALYYPVADWLKDYINEISDGKSKGFTTDDPLKFQVDLEYFNSSSAKFIYDILLEIKRGMESGIPVQIEWHHDKEDADLKEAGEDIALLAEIDIIYIPKK